jgi:hemoglobin/transferrin/lactoferrin receptor protein
VPNNDLKPEKTLTTDFAINFYENKSFQLENNFFITKMFDPIITDNFTLNGQTNLIYNGISSIITANQNQGTANITGLSSNLKIYFIPTLVFNATVNIIKGNVTNNKTTVPLDHIAPVYGKIGFAYEGAKLNFDAFMLYNGKKNLKEYSPSGEDNLVYAPQGGTPAWETYNIKAGYKLQSANFYAGIENILDTQYRTFASGINAAGRNVYVGAKYSF